MSVPGGFHRIRSWVAARLQRRLIVTLVLVLLAVSVLFLGLVSSVYRDRITAEHARASLQLNALLQAALENAMLKRDLPGLQGIVDKLGRSPDIAAVRILSPGLDVRFASEPGQAGGTLDTDEVRAALAERAPRTVLIPDGPGGPVLRSINPVPNQEPCQVCHGPMGEHPVNGLLVVDYAAGAIGADAGRTVLSLAGIGLAVIFASSLATWAAVTRTVIAPLRKLAEATGELSAGRLSHRIDAAGEDEIGRLNASFNAMAQRLETSVEDLRASEDFLQSVIDGIPDAIRVIDSDFRIIKANRAYAAHVGQPLAAVLGSPCYRSSHRRDSPCPETLVCCPVVELRGAQSALTCRQTHFGPAGEEVHVEVAAAPLTVPIDGEPRACVIEAIRDLEQQSRISQEQRLSELGLLAAGLAHEIFNPLSSVELVLSSLQEDAIGDPASDTTERVAILRTEIERTLAVTNSLLMLCQPPAREALLVDLDRVVPEALAILGYEARKSGAVIACDIAAGLRVLGSESDMRMMITNLVMNALHAMPDGGTVSVTGRAAGGEVTLSVTDSGKGIAPRDLSRIFLPFWTRRADGSNGRGLGLAIVQAIVDHAGGRIVAASKLGEGSAFTATFPDPDSPGPAS